MAQNKLLLLEDVDGLGRSGEVVSVRPGYSRNFLLPQQLAVVADKQTLRMQARLQEERAKRAVEDKKEADALAKHFEDLIIEDTVKVDHEGHMYGSVSALDIVHLLKEQKNLHIEKRWVQLHHPIKEVGTYTINLKLKEGVPAHFVLKVLPEESENALNKGASK